ncbi:hypothetical protein BDQ17DRAFT_1406650 [Cyathus striatus]|nr:hypothetical protein BDQ17DRAFT_1406650 [Cyathus striatus]
MEGGVNNEVLEQLLKAAKNLEKRVLPVFHERDQLKNVNSLLKKQTVALKETLSAKDSTIKCLQNKVKVLDQQVASESQLRNKRNIEHLAVVGRLAAETQDHRKLQKAYCEMESEVKQLKEKNDDFAKQIITLQRKNKELIKYKLQHEEDQKSRERAEKERDVTELKWVEIMKLAEEKVWFEEQVKCGLGGELSLDMKDGGCVEVHCVDASF